MNGNYRKAALVAAAGLVINYGPNTAYAKDKAQPTKGKKCIVRSILKTAGKCIDGTVDFAWDTTGNALDFAWDTTGNAVNMVGRELGKAGRSIDRYFDAADNKYVPLDTPLYRQGQLPEGTNPVKQIGRSLYLLPGNYLVTVKDGGSSIARWPGAAMDNAKAEKKSLRAKRTRQPIKRPKRKFPLSLVQVPLDVIWKLGEGAVKFTEDSTRVVYYFVKVGADGTLTCAGQTIDYAVKNPVDTGARAAITAGIADTINDSRGSGGGGGGEEPPPDQPWP